MWVTGILSKNRRVHMSLRKYVGRGGFVIGESKCGKLIIMFSDHSRAIPAGCVTEYGTVKILPEKKRRTK